LCIAFSRVNLRPGIASGVGAHLSAVQALHLLATEANPATLFTTSDGGREPVAPVAHDTVLRAGICVTNLRKIEYPCRGAFLATVLGMIDNFTALNPPAATTTQAAIPELAVFTNFAVPGAGFFRARNCFLAVTALDTAEVAVGVNVASTVVSSVATRKSAANPRTPIANTAVNRTVCFTAVLNAVKSRAGSTALKSVGIDLPLTSLHAAVAAGRTVLPRKPVTN